MSIWYLIILLLLFSCVFRFFTRQKSRSDPELAIVIGLLDTIGYNQKVIENRLRHAKVRKKFRAFNWETNRKKLEFLGSETESHISETFSLISRLNAQTPPRRGDSDAGSSEEEDLRALRESLSGTTAVLIEWLKKEAPDEEPGAGKRFFRF